MLISEKLKKHNTEWPAITLDAIPLSCDHFWCHVVKGAGHSFYVLAINSFLSDAEITHFDSDFLVAFLKVEEEVLKLQVPVCYASHVAVVHGVEHLVEELFRSDFIECLVTAKHNISEIVCHKVHY